jgi:hypothetical protein
MLKYRSELNISSIEFDQRASAIFGYAGIVGHLSSSSLTPSLSVSGIGHPWYFAKPATVGHLSCSSLIPSPSVSGSDSPCI